MATATTNAEQPELNQSVVPSDSSELKQTEEDTKKSSGPSFERGFRFWAIIATLVSIPAHNKIRWPNRY